jgi:hypothetical protein
MEKSEDEIRAPDIVITEQLLPGGNVDNEIDITEVLHISQEEYAKQKELYDKYEENIIKEFNFERNKRLEIFKEFLFRINRLGVYDVEVREIYNMIDPIIDAYCNQYIETCELDVETYTKIFTLLKKIRNTQVILPILEKIIICQT